MAKTTYIVQARDAEGRDLYPGVTYRTSKGADLAPVGKPLPADFPVKAIKQLLRQGVIAPEGETTED